jgi:hypothetical protein
MGSIFNFLKLFNKQPSFVKFTWDGETDEIENFQFFLNIVNVSFYNNAISFEINVVDGMDLYYTDIKDVQIMVRKENSTLNHRFHFYHKDRPDKYMEDLTMFLDRLNVEFQIPKQYYTYKEVIANDGNTQNSPVYYIYNEEPKIASVKVKQIYIQSPFSKIINRELIQMRLNEYKKFGLFDFLSSDTIARGYEYSLEYISFNYDEMLWNFKDFIYGCSVPESMGWESELEGFASIANGAITFSNFSKLDNEEDPIFVDIGVDINGERFYCSKLTDNFTFRFIKELNKYLEVKHQSVFLNFIWSNSPHVQQNFIYVPSKRAEFLVQNFKEFEYISDEIIDFYEEEYC